MSLQVGFLFIVITLNAYLFWRYYRCLCFCMDSLIWKTEPPSLTNHCAFTLLNMFTFLDMFILHSGMCDLNHYLPHKVCIFNQYLLHLVSVISFTCWTHLSSWLFSSWFLFFIVVTVFSAFHIFSRIWSCWFVWWCVNYFLYLFMVVRVIKLDSIVLFYNLIACGCDLSVLLSFIVFPFQTEHRVSQNKLPVLQIWTWWIVYRLWTTWNAKFMVRGKINIFYFVFEDRIG